MHVIVLVCDNLESHGLYELGCHRLLNALFLPLNTSEAQQSMLAGHAGLEVGTFFH